MLQTLRRAGRSLLKYFFWIVCLFISIWLQLMVNVRVHVNYQGTHGRIILRLFFLCIGQTGQVDRNMLTCQMLPHPVAGIAAYGIWVSPKTCGPTC